MSPDKNSSGGEETQSSNSSTPGSESIEERYRTIFRYSNDAIVIVDFDTDEFVDVNPAACEMLGYSREELLELDPEDIHPDDIDRVREQFISEVTESGSGWTDDMMCITKEGEEMPTEISGAELEDTGDETPSRMVAILRDISERVRHRRELEGKITQLEQFAQVLSHDLRNPLAIINGRLDLAQETGERQHFEAAQKAVDRMDELIDELLMLTQQGNAVGPQQSVDLELASQDAWQNIRAPDATLRVETNLPIEADPSRLQELLENLFRNAAQHCGSEVRLTVGTIETADSVGFYVADDGPGIPPDERPHIFEWGHTSAESGTGFGLAIVTQIADGHDWEIAVTESDTGGTRFEFTGVTVL